MSLGPTEREESKAADAADTIRVEVAGHPSTSKSTVVDGDQERMDVISNDDRTSHRSMDASEQTDSVFTHESNPTSASSTEQFEVVMGDVTDRAVDGNTPKHGSKTAVELRPHPQALASNVQYQMNHKDNKLLEGSSNPRKRKSSQSMHSIHDYESVKESTSLGSHRTSHHGELSTPGHVSAPSHNSEGSTEARHVEPSALTSEKIEEERARLKAVLVQTSPEVAQMVLREQWRNFLFPSGRDNDDNLSFILRAGLKNGTSNAITRVFKDHAVFKEPLVGAVSKRQVVVERVLKNASPNQLSDLVPSRVLDQVLAERLKHVPAKTLIRWLAEADRLGYSLDDILDEADESVIPKVPSRAQSHDNEDVEMTHDEPKPVQVSLDPLQADQERVIAQQRVQLEGRTSVRSPSPQNSLTCPTCFYKFDNIKGYSFHITKKICTKAQPTGLRFYCENCAQGFTTKQGKLYHEKKRVCTGEEDGGEPSPTEPSLQEQEPMVSTASDPHFAAPHPMRPREPLPPVHAYVPPPLHTPKIAKQVSSSIPGSPLDGNFRQSPSELDPAKLAALNAALDEVEERYQIALATIPADFTPEERERRMVSLKNGNASRKSQIRKSFGVTLRMREKDKEANKRFKDSVGSSLTNSTTTSNRFEEFRAPPSSSASTSQPRPPPPARVAAEREAERAPHSFSPINASQAPRPPPLYVSSHPPQPPHAQHPPPRTYSPNYPPPPQLAARRPSPPSQTQSQSQPPPHSQHPHHPRLPPPQTIHNYDRAGHPPYPHHSTSTSTSTPPLPSMALSRQDEDLERDYRAQKRLKSSPQPTPQDRTSRSFQPAPLHVQSSRTHGSESGGESRPSSAGSVGPAKKVPVRKLQRMWEALNGSPSSNANRSSIDRERERERERERDERAGTGTGKGTATEKGMGVEMLLNKGKERESEIVGSEGGSAD